MVLVCGACAGSRVVVTAQHVFHGDTLIYLSGDSSSRIYNRSTSREYFDVLHVDTHMTICTHATFLQQQYLIRTHCSQSTSECIARFLSDLLAQQS